MPRTAPNLMSKHTEGVFNPRGHSELVGSSLMPFQPRETSALYGAGAGVVMQSCKPRFTQTKHDFFYNSLTEKGPYPRSSYRTARTPDGQPWFIPQTQVIPRNEIGPQKIQGYPENGWEGPGRIDKLQYFQRDSAKQAGSF